MTDELVDEITLMEDLMHKYSEFGAEDTEPDWHFQNTLRKAINGEDGVIWPINAEWWELYTASMDCSEAGKALTKQAEKIVSVIRETKMKDFKQVQNLLKEYCWRVDI